MFGRHKANREMKRQKADFDMQKAAWDSQQPERDKQEYDTRQKQIGENAAKSKASRSQAREEGRQYGKDFMNQSDVVGLTPEQRSAMQYENNKGVQRTMQSANRKLLGDQGQRGIVGQGGVGYAQQRDLQRLGLEAQGQGTRDLDKLDADMRLKKLAALFNIEQGEATQSQLDNQIAADDLSNYENQKRNRSYEDKFNRLFSRL